MLSVVQSGVVPDEGRRLQMLRLIRDEISADLEDSEDLDASLNASGHSLMRSRPKSGQVCQSITFGYCHCALFLRSSVCDLYVGLSWPALTSIRCAGLCAIIVSNCVLLCDIFVYLKLIKSYRLSDLESNLPSDGYLKNLH